MSNNASVSGPVCRTSDLVEVVAVNGARIGAKLSYIFRLNIFFTRSQEFWHIPSRKQSQKSSRIRHPQNSSFAIKNQ